MDKIFNLDGPLFRVLSKISDLIILNILWVICSLPVVTIGAATTAAYTVGFKMAKDSEGYIVKSFFKAFKSNLKQATIIHMLFLLLGAVLGCDLYITAKAPEILGNAGEVTKYLTFVGFFLLLIVAELAFPVLAKFDNTVKNTLKNTILIWMADIGYMLIITVINFALPGIIILLATNYFTVGFIFVLCGISIPVYLTSFIYKKIFSKYENNTSKAQNLC